ncbi:MAG TPA: hypothetical protein VF131_01640 [Blastocatellia bacterium]|nr:hypothetical protein [Blastocatellia bacterium]
MLDQIALRGQERWEFRVECPHGPDDRVVEYNGYPFNHQKFDYRYLVDLESKDFHHCHRYPLNLYTLNPIVTIPNGEVYTHSITKRLSRRKNRDHSFQYFGYAAQEVGVDIRIEGEGSASLVDGVGKTLFTLRKNHNWKYVIEIENNADPVLTSAAHHSDADPDSDDRVIASSPGGGSGDRGVSRSLIDHFHFFYRILPIVQPERYLFKIYDEPSDGELRRPHPNPAICPQSMFSTSSIVDMARSSRKREDWKD